MQDVKIAELKGDVFVYDYPPEEMDELDTINGFIIEEVNSDEKLGKLKNIK